MQNLDQPINSQQNTECLEQQFYASPENFTPALLVMLETFRRSVTSHIGSSRDFFCSVASLPPKTVKPCLGSWEHHRFINYLVFLWRRPEIALVFCKVPSDQKCQGMAVILICIFCVTHFKEVISFFFVTPYTSFSYFS